MSAFLFIFDNKTILGTCEDGTNRKKKNSSPTSFLFLCDTLVRTNWMKTSQQSSYSSQKLRPVTMKQEEKCSENLLYQAFT